MYMYTGIVLLSSVEPPTTTERPLHRRRGKVFMAQPSGSQHLQSLYARNQDNCNVSLWEPFHLHSMLSLPDNIIHVCKNVCVSSTCVCVCVRVSSTSVCVKHMCVCVCLCVCACMCVKNVDLCVSSTCVCVCIDII